MAVLVCQAEIEGGRYPTYEPSHKDKRDREDIKKDKIHVLTGRLFFFSRGIISRVFLRVGTQGLVEEVFVLRCCVAIVQWHVGFRLLGAVVQ